MSLIAAPTRDEIELAIIYGIESTKKLINEKNINTPVDQANNTPLILASAVTVSHAEIQRNLEVLEYLLSLGANINHQNIVGRTALMEATTLGKIDFIKRLLQVKGINTILTDIWGSNANLLALSIQRMDIAVLMLDSSKPKDYHEPVGYQCGCTLL